VFARERRLVGRPNRLQREHVLARDGPPAHWVDTVVAHLLGVPTRTHAQHDPAARQLVERGHHLCEHDWLTLRDEADSRSEPQLLRHARRSRVSHEGIEVVSVRVRQLPADRERRPAVDGDMRVLGKEERLETALLDHSGEVSDVDGAIRREDDDAGLHRRW
jgi:hypothetical protein